MGVCYAAIEPSTKRFFDLNKGGWYDLIDDYDYSQPLSFKDETEFMKAYAETQPLEGCEPEYVLETAKKLWAFLSSCNGPVFLIADYDDDFPREEDGWTEAGSRFPAPPMPP